MAQSRDHGCGKMSELKICPECESTNIEFLDDRAHCTDCDLYFIYPYWIVKKPKEVEKK